jgi:hypothetical protein
MAVIEVHKFIEGPFELGDETWYNLCLALLPDDDWAEVEMYYSSFDAAYEDSIRINRSPYPLEVDDGCLISNLN